MQHGTPDTHVHKTPCAQTETDGATTRSDGGASHCQFVTVAFCTNTGSRDPPPDKARVLPVAEISVGSDAARGLRTAVDDIPNDIVTPLASGDVVAMFISRRPQLTAEQRDSAKRRATWCWCLASPAAAPETLQALTRRNVR
jgi:hypothetical protein